MEYEYYLAHHGVKGMKWGVRRYQNADGSLTPAGQKRAQKDMSKFEKTTRKAQKDIEKYADWRKSHTYQVSGYGDRINSVYIENPKLRRKAEIGGKKVDKLVSSLSKKYANVSAIPKNDVNTGRAYSELTIGDLKSIVRTDKGGKQ